jgi:FHA domain/Zinc-ribbon containing domain
MESLTSGTIAGTGSFRCRHCGYVLTLTGTDALTDCPSCGGHDFARASLFSAGGLGRTRITGAGRRGVVSRGSAAAQGTSLDGGPERILARRAGDDVHGEDRVDDVRVARTSRSDAPGSGDADMLTAGIVGGALAASPELADHERWLRDVRSRLSEPGEYLAYDDGTELRTVPLTREWTRIGRSLAADIRFDDPTVSRRHALIVRQADGVHVLDDRSLNGVFVNGARIDSSGIVQRALQDGDEIVVGRYRLWFLGVSA